jgi:hypothetical protein
VIKREEIQNPSSCLNKARPDEPVFVLRAQDKFAPDLVDQWADRAELNGTAPSKVDEARKLADQMRLWPVRRFPD